ncbi:MAG: PilN domain-containing protein [Candidatus Syntrophosphaera sp.]|nr:PilN domain-containing protein [Candidatus Syntrophosphaera sp.]
MTNVFYFKVNLNKYGEMKLQAERENKTFRNAVIAFLLGAIIMFAGLIYLNNSLKRKVEIRRQYYKEISARLSEYQSSGDYLSVVDVDKLAETFTDRIFWTKKLQALSHEIDQQLAVRKLNFNNGVLTLNGIIEVNRNIREGDITFDFVQRLKANPEISNDFPEIKSGSKTRQVAKDTEILEFVIECYSRDASAFRGSAQ